MKCTGFLYISARYSNGIKTIGDILDDNGNFYTFDRLKEIYRVRGTFLNYEFFFTENTKSVEKHNK